MDFTSDNAYGALPEVMAALVAANRGAAHAYGDDDATTALTDRFGALFSRDVAVFPVVSGTAANALALATLVPPHGAVLAHEGSHILVHECGAPEFFSHGARLTGMPGADGKLEAATLQAALSRTAFGDVHVAQPFAVSLSQPTELGTVYTPDEMAAISRVVKAHGLKLHLDGARFANAVAHLGCSPAEASWQAGADVLSFGASKGGALSAEAVVFFDPNDARDFAFRRKKSGHLVSKMRFVSAQLHAYLEEDRWLKSALRANALAAQLATAIACNPQLRLAAPLQTNMAFVEMPQEKAQSLRAAGVHFYDWAPPADGRVTVRLATSFATPDEDVEKLIALLT